MFLNKRPQQKTTAGFSIIEVLMVIFVISLVGVSLAIFQKDVFSLNNIISNSLSAQNEARKALKTMSAEIRSLSPSSSGAFPISEASQTSFTFYSNIDNDQFKEKVRYFLDTGTIKKGIIKPSGTPLVYNQANEIVTEIVHFIAAGTTQVFSYYDTNYDGTAGPLVFPVNIPSVRLVKITFIIDQHPNRSPGPITLTTQVSPRNLKDNL